MKKIYLLLLISCSITVSKAQLNLDNGIWVNEYTTYGWGASSNSDYTNLCTWQDDTISSGKIYRKLFICPDSTYLGALRNDSINKKVFFLPKDSANEKLLYDFNVEPGDTVKDIYFIYGYVTIYDVVIQAVDSIDINGFYHKRILIQDGYYWIEGIGCSRGLLAEPHVNISQYSLNLQCYSRNDTSYFPDYQYGACRLDLSFDENVFLNEIEIFPNPASDFITIKSQNNQALEFKIFNTAGVLVMNTTSMEMQTKIDLSELPTATYILTITGNDFTETLKIIKSW